MSATVPSALRRSLLYIPCSSHRFMNKSLGLSGQVDTLCYDLEDSVAPLQKAAARQKLLDHVFPKDHEIAVRINAISSGLALADLESAVEANVNIIVIPKVSGPADTHFVTQAVRHLRQQRHRKGSDELVLQGATRVLAMIESARAVTDLREICRADPALDGLIFAAEDFALDLSLTRTPSLSEFLYARSAVVTHARAADVPSAIDMVCTDVRGEEGLRILREECEDGRGLGFNGKQCIHPSQLPTVQRAFAPGVRELEWAVRVCRGDVRAAADGAGAWTLDGKMVDAPVVGKARAMLARAELCGISIADVEGRVADEG